MSDIASSRQRGDRRHASVSTIVAIFMLVIQLATLVWGASALHSSVNEVAHAVHEVGVTMHEQQQQINTLNVNVGVLRDRSDKK